MENSNVLVASGISKSFGEAHILKGVSFSLRKGEIHGLMGENGAGKSTLIKIMSGDYSLDCGEMLLDGSPYAPKTPKEAIDQGIRVIYQEFNVVKPLTVAENICIGNYPRTANGLVDWKSMNQKAKAILDQMGEDIPVTAKVGDLSVAEQQLVEIAKALSVQPKILVMDEPTAALNDQETEKLFLLMRKLKETGVSIIYITHRFSEMYELTDRITIMRDGETVGQMDTCDVTDEKLISLMVGREINEMFVHRRLPIGETIFSVKGLNVPGKLKDINFHAKRGEILVFFGLFGAGQSELCRAIFGDIKSEGHEITLNGETININSIKDACSHGIGFVTDDRKQDGLIPMRCVKENITLATLRKTLASKFGVIRGKEETDLSQKYFDSLNIRCSGLQQNIGSLSGGNQQKAIIARWLANDTKVLMLNMPTRGVDVGARAEIYRTLEGLCEQGVCVIVISLEMPEVLSIADRIYVMHEKRIVGELSREEATQEALMALAVGVTEQNSCDQGGVSHE